MVSPWYLPYNVSDPIKLDRNSVRCTHTRLTQHAQRAHTMAPNGRQNENHDIGSMLVDLFAYSDFQIWFHICINVHCEFDGDATNVRYVKCGRRNRLRLTNERTEYYLFEKFVKTVVASHRQVKFIAKSRKVLNNCRVEHPIVDSAIKFFLTASYHHSLSTRSAAIEVFIENGNKIIKNLSIFTHSACLVERLNRTRNTHTHARTQIDGTLHHRPASNIPSSNEDAAHILQRCYWIC